jgi:type II secretory pathway pseudopilin PulG
MSKTRTLVVLVIFGLSALVVLDNAQAEESFQSEAVVNSHCDSSGL